MGPKLNYRRYATLPIGLGLILPLALSTVSLPAAAADSAETRDVQPDAQTAASSSPSHALEDQWRFQLGGGAINMPRYPGSRDDVNRGIPLVSISYGRYFIGGGPGSGGPAGFGAFLLRNDHWAVAVSAGGDTRKTRRASDAPILNGWGDISGTAHGTLSASYSESWFSIHGSVSAAGHHEGIQATLGADLKYRPTQQLTLSIGPQVTFTNSQYAMTYFGVDSAQSEIAGIAPYRARGGVNSIGAAAFANYQLTKHWSVAAFVNYGVLQGDAADSPVTTDKTQRVIGAFAAYGF
jgi:outer membrane protein